MHCRMCSQRLTHAGKLCRECERELQRARTAAASVDTLASTVPPIDAARMASADSSGWARRIRSRPTVLVAAFSVGIATAGSVPRTLGRDDPRPFLHDLWRWVRSWGRRGGSWVRRRIGGVTGEPA